MTDIINDNIDIKLQIGTEGDGFSEGSTEPGVSNFDKNAIYWDAVEIEVELTQAAKPNYVKGKVTPQAKFAEVLRNKLSLQENDAADTATSDASPPNNGISRLVGSRFRLEVENDLTISPTEGETTVNRKIERGENSTLLFDGRLANISPIGTNLYEFVAYDPGQQAFNIGKQSGSVINQTLEITGNSVLGIRSDDQAAANNEPGEYEVKASEIVNTVVEAAGIEKNVIDSDSFIAEQNEIYISFKNSYVKVKDALNKVKERTRTEWWFDKDGTFYFGDPATIGGGVETYRISLITDTSAGITTPPYQSVRVIGSGVATNQGWSANSQIQDDEQKIVKEANIGLPDEGGAQANPGIVLDPDRNLFEPTFKYVDDSLSTERVAESTALKIADELIKQQASGEITVVGFPEIQPFDGVLMPNTKSQPMGGQLYDVYSVKHRINPSDGFITKIGVAGPNQNLRGEIDVAEAGGTNAIAPGLDLDAAVYTPDGRPRALGRGIGDFAAGPRYGYTAARSGLPDEDAETDESDIEDSDNSGVQGPGDQLN